MNPKLGRDIIAIDGTGVKVADRGEWMRTEMAKKERFSGNSCVQ